MKSQIGKKLCMGGKKAMILPSVKISKVHECLVEGFHLTEVPLQCHGVLSSTSKWMPVGNRAYPWG